MRRENVGRRNRQPERLRSLQSELATQLRSFAAETDETSKRRPQGFEIDQDAEFEALHKPPARNSNACPAARNWARVAVRKTPRTVLRESSRLDPAHYSNDVDRSWIGANARGRTHTSAVQTPPCADPNDVVILFEREGPLGIVYEQHRSGAPAIKEICSSGLAFRQRRIRRGMVLSAVQGVPVSSLGYAGALELIKDSERPLTLNLHGPAAVVAVRGHVRPQLDLVDLLRLGGRAHRAKETRKEGQAWEAAAALLTPPSDRRSQNRAAQRSPLDGWLPIHLACAEHAPPRLVKLLLACRSESAAESDDDGWLPLHVAVSFGAPIELVQVLLLHHRDAVRARDTGGNLPLHLAVLNRPDMQTRPSDEVVQALLHMYPGAARKCNNWGRSALHLAVMQYCDLFLTLRLDKDIHAIPEGSKARVDFEDSAKSDIAHALGISAVQVDIKAIRAGSVIIECVLHHYCVSHGSPEDDAKKRILGSVGRTDEAINRSAGPEDDPDFWPMAFRTHRREQIEAQLQRAEGKLRLAKDKELQKEVEKLKHYLKKLGDLAAQSPAASGAVARKGASNQPCIAQCRFEILDLKKKGTAGRPSSAIVGLLLNYYQRAATEADAAGLLPSHYAQGSIASALASAYTALVGRPPPPHPREGLEAERREREGVLQKAQAAASAQEELEAKEREQQKLQDLERMAQEEEAAAAAAAEEARALRESDEMAEKGRLAKSSARKWLIDKGFTSKHVERIEEAWSQANYTGDVASQPQDSYSADVDRTRQLAGIEFTVGDLKGLDIEALRFELFPEEAAAAAEAAAVAAAEDRKGVLDEIASILRELLGKVDECIDATLADRQQVARDVSTIMDELLAKLDTHIDSIESQDTAAAAAAAAAKDDEMDAKAVDDSEEPVAVETTAAAEEEAQAQAEKQAAAAAAAAAAEEAAAAAAAAAAAEEAAAAAAAAAAAEEAAEEVAARRDAVEAKIADADRLMEMQQYDRAAERYAEAMELPDALIVCADLQERWVQAEKAYRDQQIGFGLSGVDDLEMTLRLDKDIHTIPEGSKERTDFEDSAKSDIAYVLGIQTKQVDVKAIRAGSVIVECILHRYAVMNGNPEDDVKNTMLSEDCIIADCFVEGIEVKKLGDLLEEVGSPPAMPPPSPRDPIERPLEAEEPAPEDQHEAESKIPEAVSDPEPEQGADSQQKLLEPGWDTDKWRFREHLFSGSTRSICVGEKVEECRPVSEGVAALKTRPDEFLAVYYQTDMLNWPEDQQKYTLISRKDTEGFEPTGVSPDGWMTIIIADYERLPPIDEYPADAMDAFTDSMTYQGITLHRDDNKPLAPGRGQGICDVPALKLIGDIDPNDVCQGSVGDCWLLSAISALAEFDGAVKRLFAKTTGIEQMPREEPNVYTVTLYELSTFQPVDVVVDERLAARADGSGLLGCKPSIDAELWPCYLEKAVAAHCGGWDKIDGGQCTHAWAMLTGCKEQYTIQSSNSGQSYQCFGAFNPNEGKWETLANSPHDSKAGLWPMKWPTVGGGGDMNLALSAEQVFDRMCAWDEQNYIIGCGTKAGSDTETTDGIVDGHAYTVLTCVKNVADTSLRLVKVRNPWGQGEFESGQWDDDGPGWDQYPEVKDALKPTLGVDDGVFWLSDSEFFQYFKTIYLSASDMTQFKDG